MLTRTASELSSSLRRISRGRFSSIVAIWFCLMSTPPSAGAGELPVPSAVWVTPGGQASLSTAGTTMNITAGVPSNPNVTLNWDRFNIGRDNTVNYLQPNQAAVALNLIHQANPSLIEGQINANGQIFFLNQNGIVFGPGAQVNVRGLIASTLNITPAALSGGLTTPITNGNPAFQGNGTQGDVTVAQGASLATPSGGRVMLFGRNVTNEGSITTPDGQTVLAAGSKIYLRAPSANGNERGLLVEVDGAGIVTNGSDVNALKSGDPIHLTGQIDAARGTVDLVGLAVNQLGRVSASTAVRSGGTVKLIARTSTGSVNTTNAVVGGTLKLGANSITDASPDLTDPETTLDANVQPPGQVQLRGRNVLVQSGARVTVRGGEISAFASAKGDDLVRASDRSDSRIRVQTRAVLNVSGEDIALPSSRNALTVKLQSSELKDRPVQRTSKLFGKTVTVDARIHGRLADGTEWVGTPLADLHEAAGGVARRVAERNSVGGTIDLQSEGDIALATESVLNTSGGSIAYAPGLVPTTYVFRAGRVFTIQNADPNIAYDGVYGHFDELHPKWGPTESFQLWSGNQLNDSTSSGYTEGRDAGTIHLQASKMLAAGEFIGATTIGQNQRLPATTARDLSRPFDERPLRGALFIGNSLLPANGAPDFVSPSIVLAASANQSSVLFDLISDPFPIGITTLTLTPSQLSAERLGQVDIHSNRDLRVLSDARLDLGTDGTFAFSGSQVRIDGQLVMHSGTISLTTEQTASLGTGNGSIIFGSQGKLDVSGLWTNDLLARNRGLLPTGRIASDGGTITLSAKELRSDQGGIFLPVGSALLANGGGYYSNKGKLQAGIGGAITLASTQSSTQPAPVGLELNGELQAFGMTRGGSLSLTASSLCISNTVCTGGLPKELQWQSARFLIGGFENFSLSAEGGRLEIPSNIDISLVQRNFLPSLALRDVPDGAELSDLLSVGLLPDFDRSPVNLALIVLKQPQRAYDDLILGQSGRLSLGAGASILGEAGAKIALSSDTRMFVDGTIEAPAGQISLTLTSAISGSDSLGHFLASQTLWLGSHAKLNAQAFAKMKPPSSIGQLPGTMLNGGQVNLTAKSGYLVGESGSRINVSGTQATLDVVTTGNSAQQPIQRQLVSGRAGEVKFQAAEGIFFAGDIDGHAPRGALSGSLLVELDAQGRGNRSDLAPSDFGLPLGSRTIIVTDKASRAFPVDLQLDSPVSGADNGLGILSSTLLNASGVGNITIHARNIVRRDSIFGNAVQSGSIQFEGNPTVTASRSMILDAAGFESLGGHATFVAPYLALGNSDDTLDTGFRALPTFLRGTGRLTMEADLLDLTGASRLLGLNDVAFISHGDIRLLGTQIVGSTDIVGSLETVGNLQLTATQIYPVTLSNFTLAIRNEPAGVISFAQTGNASGAVLSVGGEVSIVAPTILQGGTLKAPLGHLNLTASESVVLLPGSLTSTSLGDQTALFGRIELGTDWVYAYNKGGSPVRQVFTTGTDRPANPFPTQSLLLQAPSVTFAASAVIDQVGGGDLLAYEFQPGLGGSNDYLSPMVSPNLFAIVPRLRLDYAPIDPQEKTNFNLSPGQSVELSQGVNGLPAGRYPLLPARFALLPGAFLITRVNGLVNFTSTEAITAPGGGSYVSGRAVFANGLVGDSQSSGYLVRPGRDAQLFASYALHEANDFKFALGGGALPRDGGVAQFKATTTLNLGGKVNSTAALGGQGSTVEIVGNALAIVANSAAHPTTPGSLLIAADGLNALGASRITIGATSSVAKGIRTLTVGAQRVEVDAGSVVTAPEIVLAARDILRVESGSSLFGAGPSNGTREILQVDGDGVVLRLSNDPQAEFARTNVANLTGVLSVEAGAVLTASGSMLLNSTLDTHLEGAIRMSGGSLELSASRISLGDTNAPVSGLQLTEAKLASIKVNELKLSSRSSIDFYDPLELDVDHLVLDSPAFRGQLTTPGIAKLSTSLLELSNRTHFTAPAVAPPGFGYLEFDANSVQLGDGAIDISGFNHVALNARNVLAASGGVGSGFKTDGSLSLSAALLTGGRLADYVLEASGSVDLLRTGVTPLGASNGLGARLSISGARIQQGANIVLPAGDLRLRATGSVANDDVTLLSGSVIDVSGVAGAFEGNVATAPAGAVRLESVHGNVRALSGSTMNISGNPAGGNAGTLALVAPRGAVALGGTVTASAVAGYVAGRFSQDSMRVTNFSQLNNTLNEDGFFGSRSIRVREGDLTVQASDVVTAADIQITTDAGAIDVLGRLDASGGAGGKIALNARDAIHVNGGAALLARARDSNKVGGRVSLASSQSGIFLDIGSLIDVSPAGGTASGVVDALGGHITFEVERATALTLADLNSANDALRFTGALLGARDITLAGRARYIIANGILDASETSVGGTMFNDTNAFADRALDVIDGLGFSGNSRFEVVPSIEVASATQDLTVASDWDLSSWHFHDRPGLLTLRAARNLTFDASLSDGFQGLDDLTVATPILLNQNSWSYRLVAGADVASPDPLQTGQTKGNFSLTSGVPSVATLDPFASVVQRAQFKAIRTGTGSIDIRASGDVTLGNRASVVYTAGKDTGLGVPLGSLGDQGTLEGRPYPQFGGNLSIAAGDSIHGVVPGTDLSQYPNQLVTGWLYRQGAVDGPLTSSRALGWTVAYEYFESGVGALGGGNVVISAGIDVDNLSVSVPTIGRQLGGTSLEQSQLEIIDGGDLTVRAGRDIASGVFYVGAGRGLLDAGGSIRAGRVATATDSTILPLYPSLALGDGAFAVSAIGDITLETIFNPTLIPQGPTQKSFFGGTSYFSTYGSRSAVNVSSTAGNIRFANQASSFAETQGFVGPYSLVFSFTPDSGDETLSLKILPPILRAVALSGNITADQDFTLYPSVSGDLQLLAANSVFLNGTISLSDADTALLPNADANVQVAGQSNQRATVFFQPFERLNPIEGIRQFASRPVHSTAAPSGTFEAPARIVAEKGGLFGSVDGVTFLAKPSILAAGQNITDLNALLQNVRANDLSVIRAGGNLEYPFGRTLQGGLSSNNRGIDIQGPGQLQIAIGGNLDLGISRGITSLGNTINPALDAHGASVSVVVGLNGATENNSLFIDKYLAFGKSYANSVLDFMRELLGHTGLTNSDASQLFRDLPAAAQRSVVVDAFFSELLVSGRENAVKPPEQRNFSRGFSAVETLFPSHDYVGDMNLFFSRIYTLAGGNIDLLAPGGFINVGLSSPPTGFGINKTASQLGIVAQSKGNVRLFLSGDLSVNESRVFAADGGDILAWSNNGDIDAGRGAKSSISAPPPIVTIDPQTGAVNVTFPPALTGSGIRALTTTPGRQFGSVDLITPRGVVNASEAGIESAGNITIAAVQVLGADNIKAGGSASGVPVVAAGVSSSVAAAGSSGSAATQTAGNNAAAGGRGNKDSSTAFGTSPISIISVEFIGFGDG